MSSLLINEEPLIVQRGLAVVFGINESIILQQVHFWADSNRRHGKISHFKKGEWWCWNTVKEWQEEFPWLNLKKIERYLADLKRDGILISDCLHDNKLDRTRWYRIDYKRLKALIDAFFKNEGSILPELKDDLYTENTFRYSLIDAQLARAQSPGRGSSPTSESKDALSDQEQNSDHDQYGHKLKQEKSERTRNKRFNQPLPAIAEKDFSEPKEPVPVPDPIETTTPSQAVLDRDTVLPRFLPKKKTKGEIKYGEDGAGWLQLPRGAKYAKARKIACRWGQEALIERYEYTDWVEEDGQWYIDGKDDLLPLEEALAPDGVFGLAAIRNYVVDLHNLAQEDFNDDLKEAFEIAIALCEKWGDRVFDRLNEWVVWREGAEKELGVEIFGRSLSCW